MPSLKKTIQESNRSGQRYPQVLRAEVSDGVPYEQNTVFTAASLDQRRIHAEQHQVTLLLKRQNAGHAAVTQSISGQSFFFTQSIHVLR